MMQLCVGQSLFCPIKQNFPLLMEEKTKNCLIRHTEIYLPSSTLINAQHSQALYFSLEVILKHIMKDSKQVLKCAKLKQHSDFDFG